MTPSPRRYVAAAVALVALAAGLGAPAVADSRQAPDRGERVSSLTSSRSATTQVQRVRVNWKGNWRKRDYVKTAVIPGIGSLDLICKPDDTRIRLYTDARGRETQMWLQKYETKDGQPAVAVKNARIYQWAHDDDTGRGGTGYYAHEGLNQHPGIENRSQGSYLYGVISQRTSRAAAGGAVATPLPITTFELDWNWNGFAHPLAYRSCSITAVITTQFPATARPTITWRGWEESPVETTQATMAGIGQLNLSCPTDRSLAPTLTIDPYSDDADLFVQEVRGEGLVSNQREETELELDAETGLLGPFPLPSNGTLRLHVTNGAADRWVLLSSVFKTNDTRTNRNFCDIAAGFYNR